MEQLKQEKLLEEKVKKEKEWFDKITKQQQEREAKQEPAKCEESTEPIEVADIKLVEQKHEDTLPTKESEESSPETKVDEVVHTEEPTEEMTDFEALD